MRCLGGSAVNALRITAGGSSLTADSTGPAR